MLPTCVRYSNLEQVLLHLGFVKHIGKESRVWFEHSDGATFATRAYTPEEVVREIVVMAARSTMEEWGIADRETFERMLADSIVKPTPPTANVVAA